MPIEMLPEQKYAQFLKNNPQYKKLSRDKIYSIMVKQKLLTQSEVNALKQPLFNISYKPDTSFVEEGLENFGISLNATKNKQKPTNYVERPKKYHSRFKELEITKSGSVDMNQFSMNGLKSRYDIKNYNIEKLDNGAISVTKKDGTPVLSVQEDKLFNSLQVSFPGENDKVKVYSLSKTGDVKGFHTIENRNGVSVFKNYGLSKTPHCISESYPDGSYKYTMYDKSRKIIKQAYTSKNGGSWNMEFVNGMPYKKKSAGNIEYILVNDLEKDITARNALGLPTTRSSLSNNVLQRINKDTAAETLEKYQEKTGRSLITDIKNEIGLSSDLRDKLINHISKMAPKKSAKESGNYIGECLYNDIQGIGSGKLAEHVKMINSENIKYVLTKYRECDSGIRQTFKPLNELFNEIGLDIVLNANDKTLKKMVPIEGLLTAISNEWGLKESERKRLIKHIVDTTLNEKPPEVQSRIKRDISTHSKDFHKVEVDLYRATNIENGELRNPELDEKNEIKTKNNTFNGQIKQGAIGDCWLLAGLNSIITKPQIRKELEKLVKHDPKTGDYIINLRGAKKTYRVTKRDLNEYTAIANGSQKVNAIEIAMDKYIRDNCYNKRKNDIFEIDEKFHDVNFVSIDGNNSRFLWKTLFGETQEIEEINVATEDFNNPQRLYCFGLPEDIENNEDNEISGVARSQKEENYTIHSRHAYSIIGSDEKNIYCLNPWDSSDKITISRKDFMALNAVIEAYDFPKN